MSQGDELLPSRTVSVSIAVPPDDAYRFVADPNNLPRWSFFESVISSDRGWVARTPEGGEVGLRMTPQNDFGILDHFVQPPSRPEIHVPMRVVPNGAGCEVLFTLFRMPSMSDDDFAADVAVVEQDLAALRDLLEGRHGAER